jgi:tRNA threonylcarbamoyladenosine biosynthesis protein TsaB
MRLLALETSTQYCSAALWIDGAVAESHVLAGHTHSDILLPTVKRLIDEAGLGFAQLDGIAFGAGPGSFTGLRIACGVAQGLAFAHDLPVVPVVSLESLAEQMEADAVITAFDARMGELYLAAYQRVGGGGMDWTAQIAPMLVTAPVLDAMLPALGGAATSTPWIGIGSGFGSHGAALTVRYAPVRVDAQVVPRASAVARIAARRFARGEALRAEDAAPLYLRDKVALDVREQAALRERQRGLREAAA